MHFKAEKLKVRDQALLALVCNYLQSVKRKYKDGEKKIVHYSTSIKPILIYFQINQLMGDKRFRKGNCLFGQLF